MFLVDCVSQGTYRTCIEVPWDRSFCVSSWLCIPGNLQKLLKLDSEQLLLKAVVLRCVLGK